MTSIERWIHLEQHRVFLLWTRELKLHYFSISCLLLHHQKYKHDSLTTTCFYSSCSNASREVVVVCLRRRECALTVRRALLRSKKNAILCAFPCCLFLKQKILVTLYTGIELNKARGFQMGGQIVICDLIHMIPVFYDRVCPLRRATRICPRGISDWLNK